MLDEKIRDFIADQGKCAKGSIRYYNLVAMFYEDVLYVEKLDRLGTIKIVCKPDYDSKIVGEFTEELQVGLGYEITTAKKEDIMTKRFMYELHKGVFRDDGKVMTTKEVIDTLNTIHEENEKLKKQSIHFESEMYAYKGSEEYYKQLLLEKDEEIHHLKNALNKIKEIIEE